MLEQYEALASKIHKQASDVTQDSLVVGYSIEEFWVDGGKFGIKAEYFWNIDNLIEAIVETYPEFEQEWENLGWI